MRTLETNGQPRLREALDDYGQLRSLQASVDDDWRAREQPGIVSRYYDIVTRFYEFAWGSSFHFSPRRRGESLIAAQRRHEHGIAERLRLGPGMKVADIGCGIGGPLVSIATSSGASITGININAHQISRGEKLLRGKGLNGTCQFMLADCADVPLEDEFFDAIYSFEAICHTPDKQASYAELYRLLKPGGEIAIVDWALTDQFNEADPAHRRILDGLERANATPNLATGTQIADTASSAGFEILETVDQVVTEGDAQTPWYMSLQGRDFSLSSLARIPMGRRITAAALAGLERAKLVPSGTGAAASMLSEAADALVEAGELGLFTPNMLIQARKPV